MYLGDGMVTAASTQSDRVSVTTERGRVMDAGEEGAAADGAQK